MRKVIAGISSARRQTRSGLVNSKRHRAQRTRLRELKKSRELVVLTRDAESAQRGYETAMQAVVVTSRSRASQTHV